MKCDVCGTKIPIGSNECPNCGFKYGKNSFSTYDASGETHEHIRVTSKKPIFHKPSKPQYRPLKVNAPKNLKNNQIKGMLIVVIVVFIFMSASSIMIPIFLNDFSFDWYSSGDYDNMTFQEVIDEGYDDGTVEMALEEQEELVSLLEDKLGLENVDTDEYINEYSSGMYASITVSGDKDGYYYSVDSSFEAGENKKRGVTISWSGEKSIRNTRQFVMDKDVLDILGNYVGVDIYQQASMNRKNMIADEDDENRYVYSHYDDYDIYLSESLYGDKYHFYISIGNRFN